MYQLTVPQKGSGNTAFSKAMGDVLVRRYKLQEGAHWGCCLQTRHAHRRCPYRPEIPASNWDPRKEQRPGGYLSTARWAQWLQWALIRSEWQPGLTCRFMGKTGEHSALRVGWITALFIWYWGDFWDRSLLTLEPRRSSWNQDVFITLPYRQLTRALLNLIKSKKIKGRWSGC